MSEINYQQELNYILSLYPSRNHRRALAKHLVYLNTQIIDAEEQGEPNKVMGLAYDCIASTLEMLDQISNVKKTVFGVHHE